MSDPKKPVFLDIARTAPSSRPAEQRVHDYREFVEELDRTNVAQQSSRCMDCGVPYCHTGCPLGNMIPDFNDMTRRDRWSQAIRRLHATNNFPEITGRICPAPCEDSCTLNLEGAPVTIKSIERKIASVAWEQGMIVPQAPLRSTGYSVAVVGSGPAGLACAQQLARAGHAVTVYERDDRVGGLLRYGIPDFKLDKVHIDRRVSQLRSEGVSFRVSTEIGRDVPVAELRTHHDAVVLAAGAMAPRDLSIPGRELDGVHFAMPYLCQQNRVVAGDQVAGMISAADKRVVVLGGGDTGADCVSTAIRQGARSVEQIELMPRPPDTIDDPFVWPYPAMVLRPSSAEEEGGRRQWSIQTQRFVGDGQVTGLEATRLEWEFVDGRRVASPRETVRLDADLVLLALGFVGPLVQAFVSEGVVLDERGNVAVDHRYMTALPGVFACGDVRRGQSLVVWAIWEGRQAACGVDAFLCGRSDLPSSPHVAPLVPLTFIR